MIAVQSRKQAPLASHRQSAESQRIARATSGMACRTRPYACIHARMGTGATNACTPGLCDDCGASERQDIKIIRDYCCIRSRAPTHVFQASVMIAVRKMIRSLRRTLPRKRQIRRKMSNIYSKRSRKETRASPCSTHAPPGATVALPMDSCPSQFL